MKIFLIFLFESPTLVYLTKKKNYAMIFFGLKLRILGGYENKKKRGTILL